MSLVFYVYTRSQHPSIFSSFILDLFLSLDSFILSVLLVDFFSCWKDMTFFSCVLQMRFCLSLAFPVSFSLCTTRTKCQLQSAKLESLQPCSCEFTYTRAALWSPCEPHLQAALILNRLIRGFVLMIRDSD